MEENLHLSLGDRYAVVTFHPVTLEIGSERKQAEALFHALDELEKADRLEKKIPMRYIITKANADAGGRIVNEMIDQYAQTHKETVFSIDSLGMKRYLSALKYSSMVIGNSSSGLVEAPSFHIPTINIGDRQSELSRNKFDNEMNKIIDKVEVDKVTSSVVSKQYKEGLNND